MPLVNELTECSAAENKDPNSSLPLASLGFSSLPRCGYPWLLRFDFRMAFDLVAIPATPCQSGLLQIRYYFPGIPSHKVGSKPRSQMSHQKRMPRVTSLRLPALVRPGLRLTLCWPLPARFSFRQGQLFCQVLGRLLGTPSILENT
jgi:hypothetical protein